jgi:hypothetical protein
VSTPTTRHGPVPCLPRSPTGRDHHQHSDGQRSGRQWPTIPSLPNGHGGGADRIDSLADPDMRLAQVLLPPEGHRISSSPDVPPPERIPLELLVNAEPSSQDTSHSDKTRILWGQGPRSPGPIIKDVPQYQVQQPAEANPPKTVAISHCSYLVL